jgi:hypothetical protein
VVHPDPAFLGTGGWTSAVFTLTAVSMGRLCGRRFQHLNTCRSMKPGEGGRMAKRPPPACLPFAPCQHRGAICQAARVGKRHFGRCSA